MCARSVFANDFDLLLFSVVFVELNVELDGPMGLREDLVFCSGLCSDIFGSCEN